MFTAEQIKELRSTLGVSLAKFADMLGVSVAAACRWETGQRHPKFTTQIKLNEIREKIPKPTKPNRRKEPASAK